MKEKSYKEVEGKLYRTCDLTATGLPYSDAIGQPLEDTIEKTIEKLEEKFKEKYPEDMSNNYFDDLLDFF